MKDYDNYDEIYSDYVAELSDMLPLLIQWRSDLEARRGTAENNQIWWTGVSGHPRVLAVFRKYYFAIEQLNVDREAEYSWREPPPKDAMWGKEDDEPGPGTRRHIELLVEKVARDSEALKEVVSGIVFVPVGLDDEDYPV